MQAFLKKYSDVPVGFIEDFFNIAKEDYRHDELSVYFDNVVKWLDVQKAHLKRLLIDKFEKDYDYIIKEMKVKNKNGRGANYVELIKITPDCFKELCMLSQTAKAKEVRKYYLTIEKLMKKYHELIEEKLYKHLGLLKTNQKPKTYKKGGVIYIVTAQNTDGISLYKIGKSMNMTKRLKSYNTGNANDIEPLFIIQVKDIDKVEGCVKNLVKEYQYRKYKEVYEIDLHVLKKVCNMCDELVDWINGKKGKEKINKLESSEQVFLVFSPEKDKKESRKISKN